MPFTISHREHGSPFSTHEKADRTGTSLGQELFKQYQVGINFRKNEITLYNYKNALVRSSY